ncbi:hypothetical protein ID866_10412 [Astraeus odoratus]|nr:hypothetical protein ID866_10412 [Astraeus odoratus]
MQNAEITAGAWDILGYHTMRSWEWDPVFPLRAVIPVYMTSGLPFFIAKKFNCEAELHPLTLFRLERLSFLCLSSLLDVSVSILAPPPVQSFALLLLSSSYVTHAFYIRPFSNSLESVIVALCLEQAESPQLSFSRIPDNCPIPCYTIHATSSRTKVPVSNDSSGANTCLYVITTTKEIVLGGATMCSVEMTRHSHENFCFQFTWILFNLVFAVVFGIMHQGGIIPSLFYLHSRIADSATNAHIIYWKTYMPPRRFLGIPLQRNTPPLSCLPHVTLTCILDAESGKVTVTDLAGGTEETLMRTLLSTGSNTTFLVAPIAMYKTIPGNFSFCFIPQTRIFPHLDMDHLRESIAVGWYDGLGLGVYTIERNCIIAGYGNT